MAIPPHPVPMGWCLYFALSVISHAHRCHPYKIPVTLRSDAGKREQGFSDFLSFRLCLPPVGLGCTCGYPGERHLWEAGVILMETDLV